MKNNYSMRYFFISFCWLLFSFSAFAQKYKPVDAGSKIHFIIKNFGINTGGDLSGLKGDIIFSPANLSSATFNVSVNANTINTDNGTRDGHLKGKEYFDAEKYPVIIIKSSKINKTSSGAGGNYIFTGSLTMRNVTKPISFPFTSVQKGNDYLFTGTFSINRLDYGVGNSSAILSNTVKISLAVLGKKS